MDEPYNEPARERARARKVQSLVSVQREISLQIVGAACVFALVTVVAAWFIAVPNRYRSALAVRPVLVRFIEAGAADDLTAVRLLLSNEGLRDLSEDQLREAVADKSLWTMPSDVQVNDLDVVDRPGGNHEAVVDAIVVYSAQSPARLRAGLTYEDNTWRITRFAFSRNRAEP